jgi:hypothetical protein
MTWTPKDPRSDEQRARDDRFAARMARDHLRPQPISEGAAVVVLVLVCAVVSTFVVVVVALIRWL